MSFEFDAESSTRCMGMFFCLLHSSNTVIPGENNLPSNICSWERCFRHLTLHIWECQLYFWSSVIFFWSVEPCEKENEEEKLQLWPILVAKAEWWRLCASVDGMPEGRASSQRHLEKPEDGPKRPFKKKCKILLLQLSNPVHLSRLGIKWLNWNPAVRALQVRCQAEYGPTAHSICE